MKHIFIACVDDPKGFPDAKIQPCIIHMIRNSLKLIQWKDYKKIITNFKHIYQSVTEQKSRLELDHLAEKWDDKYPQGSKPWRAHWVNLITTFYYTTNPRKVIYTTNAI